MLFRSGNLIDKDSFGYVVSGEGKAKVEQGKMNTDISITNTKKSRSGGSGDSGDKKDSDGSDKKSNGVKTGDNTPIVFYIGILAAALAVILVLVGNRYLKGRKRHE